MKCETRGHHQDAFHPSNSLNSYYLKSDIVGGSAECMIINTNLLSKDHKDEVCNWSYKLMENLLLKRLNAPEKAEWEEWDGILYCSDIPHSQSVVPLLSFKDLSYSTLTSASVS